MREEILIHDENDLRTKTHTIRGVQILHRKLSDKL